LGFWKGGMVIMIPEIYQLYSTFVPPQWNASNWQFVNEVYPIVHIEKNLDPERSRNFVAVAVQLGKKIFFKINK